jgi:hypothetical protein
MPKNNNCSVYNLPADVSAELMKLADEGETIPAPPPSHQLPLEGIHGLLITITEGLERDFNAYDYNPQTGLLEVTWKNVNFWCQWREGDPNEHEIEAYPGELAELRKLVGATEAASAL